jgi:hypothetical protein
MQCEPGCNGEKPFPVSAVKGFGRTTVTPAHQKSGCAIFANGKPIGAESCAGGGRSVAMQKEHR